MDKAKENLDFSAQWDIGVNPTSQEIKEAWDKLVTENMAPGIIGPSLDSRIFFENERIFVEIIDFPAKNEN